jgi:hypothetical protein
VKVKRVCRKCGEINEVDSSNLIRKDVYDEHGTYYKIMYCDCKRCGERDVVQIDSIETLEMFRKLKSLIIKVARKNMKGEIVSPKDVNKKDRWMKDLRKKREDLNELCSGKKLFDENKKVVVEQLTFSKVGDIIESNL